MLFHEQMIQIVVAVIVSIDIILDALESTNTFSNVIGSLAVIAIVLGSIGQIIQIIGIHTAGKDEAQIKKAFWIIIVAFAAELIATILEEVLKNQSIALYLFKSISDISTIIVILFTIIGITNIASKIGNFEVANKGKDTAMSFAIPYILAVALEIIPAFINITMHEDIIAVEIIALLSGFIAIGVSIAYIFYLRKILKMLEEFNNQ